MKSENNLTIVKRPYEPTPEEIERYVLFMLNCLRETAATNLETARQFYRRYPEWVTADKYPAELLPYFRGYIGDPNDTSIEPQDELESGEGVAFSSSPELEEGLRAEAREQLINRRQRTESPRKAKS